MVRLAGSSTQTILNGEIWIGQAALDVFGRPAGAGAGVGKGTTGRGRIGERGVGVDGTVNVQETGTGTGTAAGAETGTVTEDAAVPRLATRGQGAYHHNHDCQDPRSKDAAAAIVTSRRYLHLCLQRPLRRGHDKTVSHQAPATLLQRRQVQ